MAGGWYLTVGIVLGCLFALLYVLLAAGSPKQLELSKTIGVFIATNGVIATIRLVILAVTADSLGPLTDNDRLYLMVGAIATLWLSLQTIGRNFGEVIPESQEKTKDEEDT